jgi:flagellar motor switch protein FliM
LDTQLIDDLTSRMTSTVTSTTGDNLAEQLNQLPIRLNCVVTSLQLPLTEVLNLAVGDMLPTRLREHCNVEINQQKLFRGTIFEEDGALFLTSLESVKTS